MSLEQLGSSPEQPEAQVLASLKQLELSLEQLGSSPGGQTEARKQRQDIFTKERDKFIMCVYQDILALGEQTEAHSMPNLRVDRAGKAGKLVKQNNLVSGGYWDTKSRRPPPTQRVDPLQRSRRKRAGVIQNGKEGVNEAKRACCRSN